MKKIFLFYYLIVQTTIIYASNQHLGCFIDQIGNRDLEIFIGDYEQLTPEQCILACQEQHFLYAAIQYGNECRCGQQYGKYGQVSDDECDYLCLTSDKCGGNNRNSVYRVVNSIDTMKTDVTCQNNLIGYQGCFDGITLKIVMNVVKSIEECVKRCAVKYNYAGIMNGNLCHCGNDLNQVSLNSNLCNIPCHKSSNDRTSDCCGGFHVFSVYNIDNYQSPSIKDLSETIIRVKRADAANVTTLMSTATSLHPGTTASSILTVITSTSSDNTTSLHTAGVTSITSHPSITTSFSLPISTTMVTSTISTILNSEMISSSGRLPLTTGSSSPSVYSSTASSLMLSSTNINQPVSFTTMSMSDTSTAAYSSLITSSMTSNALISSTNTVGTLTTTSHMSTSPTSMSTGSSTLVVISTIPTNTNSGFSSAVDTVITVSQSSTNFMTTTMSSVGSSSISTNTLSTKLHSVTYSTSIPSSLHTDTSQVISSSTITNTATAASASTVIFTIQPSSHTDTTVTTHPTSSILLSSILSNGISATLTSIHMDTSSSITSSHVTGISSNSGSHSSNSITAENSASIETSITNPMTSLLTSSQLISTVSTQISSTSLSQTSMISVSSTPISSSTVASSVASSFSTIMTTESHSTSHITSTYSSHSTATVSQQSSIESSISSSSITLIQSISSTANTSLLSTNLLASSSTNVGTQSTVPTITSSLHTDITNSNIVSSQLSVTTTVTSTSTTIPSSSITTFTSSSSQTITSTSTITNTINGNITSNTISTTTTTLLSTTISSTYVISTVFIVSSNQSFDPNNATNREALRQSLIDIINLAFNCLINSSYPNCSQPRQRMKRQACASGYDVNFISNITQVPNINLTEYIVNYDVTNLCNPTTPVLPAQIQLATSTLTRSQISNILGYAYDGDFVRSTSIVTNTNTPTTDRKLWLIGAVLGPVAFVLLLICVFCYLHFKCRPRPTNRPLTKTIHNIPQVSARSPNYQTVPNESVKEKASTEKNIGILTQHDPLTGTHTSSQYLTPLESQRSSNHMGQYPVSIDIPMEEIRRQNDVERWRNKLRLQEKFQHPSLELPDSSVPNTNRSIPHQYDNQAFEYDPRNINIQPIDDIISIHTPRPMPQTTEIEVGRTKLHRLLDEVLDKAESDEYNPDSEIERQKRRRQRRRIHSISDDQKNPPIHNDNQQIRHTPIIPQVSERPDPAIFRLRYNPYEAGDRANDIAHFTPVELKPKYATDDNEIGQRYTQSSARSNPPLFYDDSMLADRAATATDKYATPKRIAKTRLETDREAMMRHDGGRIEQRQHKFNDDVVYIDPITKNSTGYRVQARTAWVEPEINTDPLKRNDYRDEYIMAKRSVLNTRNIISSIHDELQNISFPLSDSYHA